MKSKIAGTRTPKTDDGGFGTSISHRAEARPGRNRGGRHLHGSEALAPAEAGLYALFAAMRDVVLVIDRLGVYREIAPTHPGLLYEPPHELLGKNLRDVFPAEEAERLLETMGQVLATGQTARTEYELPISGRRIWFATSISRMDQDRTLWVARDITESKQSAEALRIAHADYRSLFENSPVGIYQSTLQGSFIKVNPAMARIFGYASPEEMLHMVTSIEKQSYVDPNARREFQRLISEQSEVQEFTALARRKDGKTIWIRENARVVTAPDGSVLYYEGFMTDISKAKQAEEALSTSEARFRLALDNSPVVVSSQDAELRYTWLYNPHPGFDPQFVIGKTDSDLLLPEDAARLTQIKRRVLETGIAAREQVSATIGGQTYFHDITVEAVHDTNGITIGVTSAEIDVTAAKRADEERGRLAAIVSSSEDAIIGATLEGVITSWNPGAHKAYQFSPEEAIGQSISLIFPPERHDELREILSALEHGKHWEHYETVRMRKDGVRREVSVSNSAIKDGSGRMVSIASIARDITERKQVEAALRDSDDRFRQIVETAQEGVWTLDTANRTTLVNKCLADMLGYTIEEMLGKSLLDFMDGEDKKVISGIGLANTQRRANAQFEFKFLGKDGRTVRALMKTSRLLDHNGQNTGALAMVTDITERRRAEAALIEKERILSEAQRIAHIGSWGWDFVGPIQWTEETYRVYGVSPDTFVPTVESLVSLLHPDDRLPMQQWIEAHAAGESPADLDFRAVLPDGSVHFLTGRGGELRHDSQNRPVYMTGTVQDITELRRLERELNRMQDSLLTINRELEVALARQETLARTDGLTGLCNRIYFDELAAREFQAAVRYQRALTILMIDVDNFKRINDTFGHAAGDEVLALIAHTAAQHIRATDVLARLGGDEFILLLPETSARQALAVAERIRTRVAATPIRDAADAPPITLSIGIAEIQPKPMDKNVQQIIHRADQALYQAKAKGRNCVVALQEEGA